MSDQKQFRRGTTAQHASFTGAVGEVTVDTDKSVVVVHDGATAGGHAMPKNAPVASGVNTLAFTQSATGDPVIIGCEGTDTDIDIQITPKGAGEVLIGGQPVLGTTITTPADGDILEYDTGEFINTTPKEVIIVACSDETTALVTTGNPVVTFRMPFAMTLSAVRASLTGAGSTSGTTTVDINDGGTTILSTKLTIDATELTSTTAATAAVISDTALADDAQITIDIDAVTGGADETGLKVYLIGRRT